MSLVTNLNELKRYKMFSTVQNVLKMMSQKRHIKKTWFYLHFYFYLMPRY